MSMHRMLAIFAGAGDLPQQLIHSCQQQNRPFMVLAFHGQTDFKLVENVPHQWTHLGTIGHTLKVLQEANVKEIVFGGAIKRPAWHALKVDKIGAQWLAQLTLKAFGDDQLLQFIATKLETWGFSVVSANHIIPPLLAPLGALGTIDPNKEAWKDIHYGQKILQGLYGLCDIGQAIVIQQGLILGVEAIEGTDALISRCQGLARPGPGPILIKMAKPLQDNRFDQPTIGPVTIQNAITHHFQGIAIHADHTLMLHPETIKRLADENSLFIVGIG